MMNLALLKIKHKNFILRFLVIILYRLLLHSMTVGKEDTSLMKYQISNVLFSKTKQLTKLSVNKNNTIIKNIIINLKCTGNLNNTNLAVEYQTHAIKWRILLLRPNTSNQAAQLVIRSWKKIF